MDRKMSGEKDEGLWGGRLVRKMTGRMDGQKDEGLWGG